MKNIRKTLSIALATVMLLSLCAVAFGASASGYTIVSPYEDVVWDGEDAWGAYKGTLHSHTTYSDGTEDYPTMIKEYYEQGYDFLAMADHGITGIEWNKKQKVLPLYAYQKLIGKSVKPLTDEEYAAITGGSYALYDGTVRGKGMTCVTGANELNCLTLTKCHVNGYFLGKGVGDGYYGSENGYEQALAFVEKNGGLSHINHPGDWLETNKNKDAVNDPENVEFFADLILRYNSCLGTEVFNENNGTTGYDRILWDNLLKKTLPYGKTVIGFSNTDAHDKPNIDTSFSVFMMEENNVDSIKAAMQKGNFFAVTRAIRANDTIGPASEIDARNTDTPYPMFTELSVEGHKITLSQRDSNRVQWIGDGKVILEKAVTDGESLCLDLDTIEGAEDLSYVRAELFGEGGMCISQALVLDDGAEKPDYVAEKQEFLQKVLTFIKSTRLYVIFQEIVRAIG